MHGSVRQLRLPRAPCCHARGPLRRAAAGPRPTALPSGVADTKGEIEDVIEDLDKAGKLAALLPGASPVRDALETRLARCAARWRSDSLQRSLQPRPATADCFKAIAAAESNIVSNSCSAGAPKDGGAAGPTGGVEPVRCAAGRANDHSRRWQWRRGVRTPLRRLGPGLRQQRDGEKHRTGRGLAGPLSCEAQNQQPRSFWTIQQPAGGICRYPLTVRRGRLFCRSSLGPRSPRRSSMRARGCAAWGSPTLCSGWGRPAR